MRPDELERRLRERLDALGPARRAQLLHVLTLSNLERAERIPDVRLRPLVDIRPLRDPGVRV